MKKYIIWASIILFALGWVASGSLTKLLGNMINWGSQSGINAIVVASPILLIVIAVWLVWKMFKT